MNCWDVLGIEPTSDRQRIERAHQQQLKFATADEAQRLEQAFREATGEAPAQHGVIVAEQPDTAEQTQEPLDAYSAQVAREVVIQIKALLNDSFRAQNADVWKAILCEPPADQTALRREIARQLEPQLRPMAENGTFPAEVTRFLGDWFEWFSLHEAAKNNDPELQDERNYPDSEMLGQQQDEPPQMVNFWPAVVGWVVGLLILASLFGGMGGG